MKNNEIKHKFIEMRAKGVSFDKISYELKTAKSTLIEWSKKHLMEIENLKAIELEALQEKFYLTKAARIELLGEQIERMKEELERRDYADIPTDKLLESFSKILNQLKQEEVILEFQQEGGSIKDMLANVDTVTWKP